MTDAGLDQLAALLQPLTVEEFLASSWGRAHAHIKGQPGRFAHLLTWARLGTILREHRLDFPRLRLARDGKSLPAANYLRYTRGGGRRQVSVPRLLPTQLTRELRAGATLVLDAGDEPHQPLTELAVNLERFFRVHVQVKAYAGW